MRNSHRHTHTSHCWFANSLLLLLCVATAGFGVPVGASVLSTRATALPANVARLVVYSSNRSLQSPARQSLHQSKYHFSTWQQLRSSHFYTRTVTPQAVTPVSLPPIQLDAVSILRRARLNPSINHARATRGQASVSLAGGLRAQLATPGRADEEDGAARRQTLTHFAYKPTLPLPRFAGSATEFPVVSGSVRERKQTHTASHNLVVAAGAVPSAMFNLLAY